MKKTHFIKVLLLLCVLLAPGLAQVQSSNNEASRHRTENKAESAENPASPIVFQRRGLLPFKQRVSREQKKQLAPDAADLKRYEFFLNQPKTGLIKLFPDLGCEDNAAAVVRADEICLKAVPMSGFYSFREKEYTNDFLSDIRLKDNFLVSDGLLAQGILVALGDVPLESVSTAAEGMKYINDYTPETQSGDALKQTKQLIRGVKSGKFLYKKSLPAKENTTYALRAVAYRGRAIQTFRGYPFDMLAGDERVDITVAFRILKKDEAGTLTLLWRELARKDAPKIIFPKRRKNY